MRLAASFSAGAASFFVSARAERSTAVPAATRPPATTNRATVVRSRLDIILPFRNRGQLFRNERSQCFAAFRRTDWKSVLRKAGKRECGQGRAAASGQTRRPLPVPPEKANEPSAAKATHQTRASPPW